jgi:hypothetical protein
MSMTYFELLRQLERLDAPPRAEVRIEVGPINAATDQLELDDAISVELRGSEVIIRGEETYKEECSHCGITCKDDTEMINHLFDWHPHKISRAKEEPKQLTVDYLIALLQAAQRDYFGDAKVSVQCEGGTRALGIKRQENIVMILGG